MVKKVVYNHKPDPIVSIKEYEYDSDGKLKLIKEAVQDDPKCLDQPQPNKVYSLKEKDSSELINLYQIKNKTPKIKARISQLEKQLKIIKSGVS